MSKLARSMPGSRWVHDQLRFIGEDADMSELGINVANLMNEWLFGIHNYNEWDKVNWASKKRITVHCSGSLSTYDISELVRMSINYLVRLRIDVSPRTSLNLKITFRAGKRDFVVEENLKEMRQRAVANSPAVGRDRKAEIVMAGYVRRSEACDMCGSDMETINRIIKRGYVESFKSEGTVWVSRRDVKTYIENRPGKGRLPDGYPRLWRKENGLPPLGDVLTPEK